MATKKIEHNGKKLTVAEWSKDTGIAEGTIRDRLKLGWDVERTLTAPSDTTANLPDHFKRPLPAAGRELKESFLSLALKAYKRNESACEAALDAAFQTDPLKAMRELGQFLPKDAIERAVNHQEKAIVRIELMQTPQRIEYVDANGGK